MLNIKEIYIYMDTKPAFLDMDCSVAVVVVAVVAVVVVVASCHVDVERRFKADPHLFTLYFVTFRRVGQIDRAEDGRYGRGGVGRRLVVGETTACNGLERRIDFRRAIR